MGCECYSYKPNYNWLGHDWQSGGPDGYAKCHLCGCIENTDDAAKICPESRAGKENAALKAELAELNEDYKQLKEAYTHFRGTVKPALDKRIAELEAGLHPFVAKGSDRDELFSDDQNPDDPVYMDLVDDNKCQWALLTGITIGDFRRAARLLKGESDEDK